MEANIPGMVEAGEGGASKGKEKKRAG